MKKLTLAFIITQPGHLQNGLHSLLRSIPEIEIIAESQDPSILSKMGAEIRPDLIVLGACLIKEKDWIAIQKLKADCPQIKVLVLTDNADQGERAREVGADFSLPKGFPAAALVNLIQNSLEQNEENTPLTGNHEKEISTK